MALYPNSVVRTLGDKLGETPSILDFNAKSDGTTDNKVAIQNGLNSVSTSGGGALLIPHADVSFLVNGTLTIPSNVYLVGLGPQSLIKGGTSTRTTGLFNISGSNCGLSNFGYDGGVTTPVGITYASFGSDPYSTTLTNNSFTWLHPGASNVHISKLNIQHSGGYVIIIDADSADVTNVSIDDCDILNNRAFLFGTNTASCIYGAWASGIWMRGDCRSGASKLFAVRGCQITNNRFSRNTGNAIWGHSLGFDTHHTDIKITGNTIIDNGLDGIQPGNMAGVIVDNNTLHRIGYTTVDDTTASIPRWLPALNASGLDSTGFVAQAVYSNNQLTSVNGGFIDLDGMRQSVVRGNVCVIPDTTDPLYTEDSIAACGTASSQLSYGINLGNTSLNGGAADITIEGNQLRNMHLGAIRMSYAKRCKVTGNQIYYTSAPAECPIFTNAVNSTNGSEWWVFDNKINDNFIFTGTATFANMCIAEIGDSAAYGSATCTNTIFNNQCQGSNQGEFIRNGSSSSIVGVTLSGYDPTATGSNSNFIGRTGFGANAALQFYKLTTAGKQYIAELGDVGPLLNIAEAGTNGTITSSSGLITTGLRVGAGTMKDLIFTGKSIADGFTMLGQASYADADANQFNGDYGLMRYLKGTGTGTLTGTFQISTATLSSTRLWQSLTFGSAVPPGADTDIVFNSAGAYGASANLTWNGSCVNIIGSAGLAGLNVSTGFIQSAEGFFSLSTSAAALNIAKGDATAVAYISIRNDGDSALVLSRGTNGTASGQQWGLNVGTAGLFQVVDRTGTATRLSIDTAGLVTIGNLTNIDQSGNVTFNGIGQWVGTAGGIIINSSTAFNAIQTLLGGIYAVTGFTSDQAFYPRGISTSTHPTTPGGTYGGLGYNAGSKYWYYNGSSSAWALVDLSATGVVVGGADKQVQFNQLGVLGTDTNIIWDYTNHRLGLANPSPNYILDVKGSVWLGGSSTNVLPDANASNKHILLGDAITTNVAAEFTCLGNTTGAAQIVGGIQFANYAVSATDKRLAAMYGQTDGGTNSGALVYYLWTAGTAVERGRFTSLGNLLIGTSVDDSSGGNIQTNKFISAVQGYYTVSTAYNSIQSPNGGVYSSIVTLDKALYPKTSTASTGLATPGAGYSGFTHKTGSQFWYYNPTTPAWASVDFASIGGGVTAINPGGLTGTVTFTANSGASLSQSGNTLTITNAGVTSLVAGANIAISAATGTCTITATAAGNTGEVQLRALAGGFTTSTGLLFSTISQQLSVGGVVLATTGFNTGTNGVYKRNGTIVINTSGAFVGAGVDVGTNGVAAAGYNVTGGGVGQTWTINIPGGFTISGVGTFSNLIFQGGVLVSAS